MSESCFSSLVQTSLVTLLTRTATRTFLKECSYERFYGKVI